jgi:hypothetical protein
MAPHLSAIAHIRARGHSRPSMIEVRCFADQLGRLCQRLAPTLVWARGCLQLVGAPPRCARPSALAEHRLLIGRREPRQRRAVAARLLCVVILRLSAPTHRRIAGTRVCPRAQVRRAQPAGASVASVEENPLPALPRSLHLRHSGRGLLYRSLGHWVRGEGNRVWGDDGGAV